MLEVIFFSSKFVLGEFLIKLVCKYFDFMKQLYKFLSSRYQNFFGV